MRKCKFPGTGLQIKADSEGLGRGEKGKEKQDKKTMTLHSKMLCRKPKRIRVHLAQNSYNNSKMATELVLDTPIPSTMEKD